MKDDRLHELKKESKRNHIIVDRIISSMKGLTVADVYYLRYQLLQHNNSYELSEMSDAEFHKRLKAIIGG